MILSFKDQWHKVYIRTMFVMFSLQGVQAAVESQITKLAIENPAQKIAIVTFSDEVGMNIWSLMYWCII